jgi:cyclohexanecarboxylate-CoA ligase/acyl-CoA synthetase
MTSPSDQLLRSAEYHQAGYWGTETFADIIGSWADGDPDRAYLSDGTTTLSYGQFRDQAWTLAGALAGLGIRQGDRVAVQLPNWNEFFLVYAACARLGVIIIPIIPVYRAAEVGFIISDSDAVALITCGTFRGFDHAAMAAGIVASAGHRVIQIVVRAHPPAGALTLDSLLSSSPPGELPGRPSPDDPHLILYSSGTESRPKGCLHTWNTSSFLPKQAIPAMGMTRDDVMFMPSPVAHALGLTLGLMAPTLAGAAVELLDIFQPGAALDRMTQQSCTGTASPAPFIRMMLDAYDPEAHDVSALRFWLTAGAPIPASLVEEAAARFAGCRVVPAYGSSEVMMATVCTPDDPLEKITSSDGRAVPGVELRIVADGEAAPAGVDGEIRYRGPGRLLRYWNRDDLTAEASDEDGWWRTGDTGRLDEAGYLRVTGRIKDIIIRGGFNISAREIEEALLGLPSVAAAAVIGLPDSKVGERACAVIELTPETEAPTLEQVRDYLTSNCGLAIWKVPERLEIVSTWPVTATGKVQKYLLRDTYGA